MNNFVLYTVSILIFLYIVFIKDGRTKNINICISNSFKGYHKLPQKSINCLYYRKRFKCTYKSENGGICDAFIYNGNRRFPTKPNSKYNIIMTIEKLSQVKFMKDIADGKNKYYQLAIDYRLFKNKWHISYPYIKDVNNLYNNAKNNFNNIDSFMNRKNRIVYIQRHPYNKRQYLVKEIMKFYDIDSFGFDLNNKKWPDNISRSDKIGIYKEYKFCLAIENSVILWKKGEEFVSSSINDYYVTEKLPECLMAGCIPIYFGPKNIGLFLPHNDSIINLKNFDSIFSLTKYLKRIENNRTLLSKHLEWYNKCSDEWINRFSYNFKFSYCNVCNYVKLYSNTKY